MDDARGRSAGDWAILVIAALNAVAAAGGAAGLTWGFLDLGSVVTSRLPWQSPVVGGVALALSVAVPNAMLTALAARRDRRAGPLAVVVGAALVLWILVELAFIRELSFFHPLYLVIGLALVRLGLGQAPERPAAGLPDVAGSPSGPEGEHTGTK